MQTRINFNGWYKQKAGTNLQILHRKIICLLYIHHFIVIISSIPIYDKGIANTFCSCKVCLSNFQFISSSSISLSKSLKFPPPVMSSYSSLSAKSSPLIAIFSSTQSSSSSSSSLLMVVVSSTQSSSSLSSSSSSSTSSPSA